MWSLVQNDLIRNHSTSAYLSIYMHSFLFQHQRAIYIYNAQSGFMHTLPSTQTSSVNQGYHQIWIPEIQRYNGQQPVNMQNNHQPAANLQGSQMTIQGYHGKQPQAFVKG